jgi:hypothetical protein
MIDNGTFGDCQYYGEDSGFAYNHKAKVVGVESNSGNTIMCEDCQFRYECLRR